MSPATWALRRAAPPVRCSEEPALLLVFLLNPANLLFFFQQLCISVPVGKIYPLFVVILVLQPEISFFFHVFITVNVPTDAPNASGTARWVLVSGKGPSPCF